MAVKLMTGKATCSYAYVFEPRKGMKPEDEPKYSISLIFPKTDKASIKAIQEAIASVVKDKWGGKVPKSLKLPLRDGDTDREGAEYAKSLFLNASSERRPLVIDHERNPLTTSVEFYSGCKVRASISFYPFDRPDSKGVGVGLNGVQKIGDGKRLDGSVSAEDFETVDLEESVDLDE